YIDGFKVACIATMLTVILGSPLFLGVMAGVIAASLFLMIKLVQTPDPLLALEAKIKETITNTITPKSAPAIEIELGVPAQPS
ncbi:MAG: hypothetical protein ACKOPT_06030, partial [Cyanobium sp.]